MYKRIFRTIFCFIRTRNDTRRINDEISMQWRISKTLSLYILFGRTRRIYIDLLMYFFRQDEEKLLFPIFEFLLHFLLLDGDGWGWLRRKLLTLS